MTFPCVHPYTDTIDVTCTNPSERTTSWSLPPSQTEPYSYTSLCRPYEQPTPSNSISQPSTIAISHPHNTERSRQQFTGHLAAAIGKPPAARVDRTQVPYSAGHSVTDTYEEILYHELSQVYIIIHLHDKYMTIANFYLYH